jgi:hypothetical protein
MQCALQTAPTARLDIVAAYFAFKLHRIAGPNRIDAVYASSVFVAKGQVEQQILHSIDADGIELCFECGANTFEFGKRDLIQLLAGHKRQSGGRRLSSKKACLIQCKQEYAVFRIRSHTSGYLSTNAYFHQLPTLTCKP